MITQTVWCFRLESVTRGRRTVAALWIIVAALAVGVVAVSLWGNGSTPESPVARYIKSVDDVQKQMKLPLSQLLTAYQSFSTRSAGQQEQARLAGAERTLRTLEQRLSELPAPPDAAKLRLLLLELVRAEDRVAVEIDQLARFMPRFHDVIGVATVANTRLGRELAAIVPPKAHAVSGTKKQIAAARAAYAAAANRAEIAQAVSVEGYARVLARALRELQTLRPPAVMAPAYRAQLRTLEDTRRAGTALARELRKRNRTAVPVLSRHFAEASRVAGSVASQRAEIAAVKAYNARVRKVASVDGRIRREFLRLQRLPR